jgi:hypothetical protein
MMIFLDDESYAGFPMRINLFYTIHAFLKFLVAHNHCKVYGCTKLTILRSEAQSSHFEQKQTQLIVERGMLVTPLLTARHCITSP